MPPRQVPRQVCCTPIIKRQRDDSETRIQIFCLDRIVSLVTQPDSFQLSADFDAEAFFSDCYGVVGDGTPPTTIRLRAFGRERYGLQDLPIHHSQRQLAVGLNYIDYEVRLCPTADFKAFIASKGQWLVVFSPKSVADNVVVTSRGDSQICFAII